MFVSVYVCGYVSVCFSVCRSNWPEDNKDINMWCIVARVLNYILFAQAIGFQVGKIHSYTIFHLVKILNGSIWPEYHTRFKPDTHPFSWIWCVGAGKHMKHAGKGFPGTILKKLWFSLKNVKKKKKKKCSSQFLIAYIQKLYIYVHKWQKKAINPFV